MLRVRHAQIAHGISYFSFRNVLVKLFLVLSNRNSDQVVTKKHIRTQDFF